MSREIKFRAWNLEKQKMFNVFGMHWKTDHSLICGNDEWNGGDVWCPAELSSKILMQFTGLLDKNGKEIYEGDIVTIEGGRGNMRVTGLIDGSFHITHVKKDEFLLRVSFLKKGCKIIGNIYENPELLFPK